MHSATVEEAVHKTEEKIRGGYALVIMSPRKLIGARDPYGLKPLCLGKRDNAYVLASESCALTSVGAEFIRDIEPGEIVTITKNGLKSSKLTEKKKHAHCVFEYIYFARLDSTMDGVKIYDARIRGGKSLAKSYPGAHDHKSISSADLLYGFMYCFLYSGRMHTFSCDMERDNL